jgi:hypothetical protein
MRVVGAGQTKAMQCADIFTLNVKQTFAIESTSKHE